MMETKKKKNGSMMSTCLLGFMLASLTSADMMPRQKEDYDTLYPMLGKNSLEELSFNYTLEVDDDCNYNFTVYFKLNPNFPVGGPDTCLPSLLAEYDGNSMLEGRWMYSEFGPHVQEAIEVNHVSIDWNPCGHPVGGFLSPHFDLHFYRVSPTYRATKMLCEQIPGTPACWPEQYYEEGQKFFNLPRNANGQIPNMPPGFELLPNDAVVNMGAHCLDPSKIPPDPSAWTEPSYIMLSHDDKIICWEPMLPSQFTLGDQAQYADQKITYVDQTDMTLPTRIISKYDPADKLISVSALGKSNVCKEEFEAARKAFEEMSVSSAFGMKHHSFWSFLVGSSLALIMWSGFL